MPQSETNPLIFREISSSYAAFILSIRWWKRIVIGFSTIVSKQTARRRNSGCCKHEQNETWAIWWFRRFSFKKIWLIIKTHMARLKMIKHQRQNIPMKVIQNKEKQTKLLHFPTSWYKFYQIMKSQKVKIP